MSENESNPEPTPKGYQALSSFAAFAKKHLSRKMIIERLYGPVGSVIFHVVLVIILFSIVISPTVQKEVQEIKVTVVEPVPTKMVEDFKPPEPQKIPDNVEIPDVATPDDAVAVPGAAMTEVASAGGGGGGGGEGFGDGGAGGDGMEGLDAGLNFISDVSGPLVFSGLYAGRGKAGRAAGLAQYSDGKGSFTEPAVNKALEWLKNHQNADGSWGAGKGNTTVAFTGMAVLAFLAHGETLGSEQYGETLQKGLRWLIEVQNAKGLFSGDSYAHGIATYAISEGYALTQVPFLKDAMEKAVDCIIKGQQDNGGWTYGYAHDKRRDTSVMGWQLQALKAASGAGCSNPELAECLRKATIAFKLQYYESKPRGAGGTGSLATPMRLSGGGGLDKKGEEPKGTFCYAGSGDEKTKGGGNEAMTAVGTVCLEFVGEGASREARGGRTTLRGSVCDWQKPGGRALYTWYYLTQALFQGQGAPGNSTGKEDWKRWNNMFAKELVNNQRGDGSWRSPTTVEDSGWYIGDSGSVYSTALAALTLMVYYRILPTYQQTSYPATSASP